MEKSVNQSEKDIPIEAHETFAAEEWVVHRSYGVGRIVAVEEKAIGGKRSSYYRIETNDSVIYAPVADADRLRPVMPPAEFAAAMDVLSRPARRMSGVYQKRLAHIRQVGEDDSPVAVARVLRDLWGRRRRRGQLSNTEERAWRRLSKRFLSEWAVCRGMDLATAKEKLYSLLEQSDEVVTPSAVSTGAAVRAK